MLDNKLYIFGFYRVKFSVLLLIKPIIMNLSLKSSLLLITIFFVANLIFISCKDENNDPVEHSRPLLATMSSYSQDKRLHVSEAYRYDSQGRLIEVSNNDKDKTTFEYSVSQVTVKSYYKDSLEETQILQLDNNGLCKATIWDENYTTNYTYDSNGYLETTVEKDGNATITQTYTVSNQNYVTINSQEVYVNTASAKEMNTDFIGKIGIMKIDHRGIASQNLLKSASDQINNYTTEFEFYIDKTNTIDLENTGIYFFGKQNKNPVKQQAVTFTDMPGYTVNYTYEYDSKGRITRQIWEDGGYDVFTYVE